MHTMQEGDPVFRVVVERPDYHGVVQSYILGPYSLKRSASSARNYWQKRGYKARVEIGLVSWEEVNG